jgi:hypothetical protein
MWMGTFAALCYLLNRTHNVCLMPIYAIQLHIVNAMANQSSTRVFSQSEVATPTDSQQATHQLMHKQSNDNSLADSPSPPSETKAGELHSSHPITKGNMGTSTNLIGAEPTFGVFAAAFLFGRAAFFYQGNSNSPSTIDISGAYTGYVDALAVYYNCRDGDISLQYKCCNIHSDNVIAWICVVL